MSDLTVWFPDIDGGYYKKLEADKNIAALETDKAELVAVIERSKIIIETKGYNSDVWMGLDLALSKAREGK